MFTRVENECAIVERHLRVLDAVTTHEPVGLVTLSNRLAYPKHKIRYSLRILEANALVESTPDGVTTTDPATEHRVELDRQLEHVARSLETLSTDNPSMPAAPSQPVASDS